MLLKILIGLYQTNLQGLWTRLKVTLLQNWRIQFQKCREDKVSSNSWVDKQLMTLRKCRSTSSISREQDKEATRTTTLRLEIKNKATTICIRITMFCRPLRLLLDCRMPRGNRFTIREFKIKGKKSWIESSHSRGAHQPQSRNHHPSARIDDYSHNYYSIKLF